MNPVYQLSGEALLYAVCLCRQPGIFGVPGSIPKKSDREFLLFAQSAEMELSAAGCGSLNFDGEFSLTPDFAELLKQCCKSRVVIAASVHSDCKWKRMTVYREAGAVLKTENEMICTLCRADCKKELDALLALPEAAGFPPELAVNTDLLMTRDIGGLTGLGYTETEAKMITDALTGAGHYARLLRVTDNRHIHERMFLYGEAGILSASAEYTEDEELLRLTPCTCKQAETEVGAMFDAPKEEPTDV